MVTYNMLIQFACWLLETYWTFLLLVLDLIVDPILITNKVNLYLQYERIHVEVCTVQQVNN